MQTKTLHITETLKVVGQAINYAEASARNEIKLYYHDAYEEFITYVLYGHIRYALRSVSEDKHIERAFIRDLKNALPYDARLGWRRLDTKLRQRATGLVADIVLHNKRQEGKTGGDFGLVIVHPVIKVTNRYLEIKKGESSGLLCQAKLKNSKGKWGVFTRKQKIVLPTHLGFTTLALYSFNDSERTDLNPVSWKLCRDKSLTEIAKLLRSDSMEGTFSTSDIIARLGRKEIGTTDQELIENIVSPSSRQHFEIKIFWPLDKDPTDSDNIQLSDDISLRERAEIKQYR